MGLADPVHQARSTALQLIARRAEDVAVHQATAADAEAVAAIHDYDVTHVKDPLP